MKICVLANDQQKAELLLKPVAEGTQFIFASDLSTVKKDNDANAYMILSELETLDRQLLPLDVPILINSVDKTLNDLNSPENMHRFIGWNTFLKRDLWEIASHDFPSIEKILNTLNWKCIHVSDQVGLISARVVSMIINEAYMTWEEGVTTKEDIDVAMKLGTNYPYGPFEWSSKIGAHNILSLLQKLSLTDQSYSPSKSLINESKSEWRSF